MKVLFVTRSYIGLGEGGLEHQINRTAECLRKRGVDIVYYNPWSNQIEDVDICHFFSTNSQMCHHVEAAKNVGKPIVISPVFGYCESPRLTMLKSRLARYIPGFCYHFVLLKRMLLSADRILCLNDQEVSRLVKIMGIYGAPIIVVPNGMDPRFAQGDPKLFENRYKIGDFILQVGSIDHNKNQLTIIKAMMDLPYRYVIIGKPLLGQEGYNDKCHAAANENVFFLGQINHDDPLLISAYKAAKVFVLPSYSEVMPLCIYEAAQAGCKVIASKNIPIADSISNYIDRAHPGKPNEFHKLIERAMNAETDQRLRQAALSMPTWQDVADKIIKIYEDVLSQH